MPVVPKHRRILGENLRLCRKQANLTQEELAEKADLSVVFISLMENGHRAASIDTLVEIAKALKVGVEDLVRGVR